MSISNIIQMDLKKDLHIPNYVGLSRIFILAKIYYNELNITDGDISIESCCVMPIRKYISNLLYNKYCKDSSIPIECLVNICLLFNGKRDIIQFDAYLYDDDLWNNINIFLESDIIIQKYLILYEDSNKNIVLYIDNDITKQIKSDKRLDKQFYDCCEFNSDKTKKNIARVSFNVIGPVSSGMDGTIIKDDNYIGQILVMECNWEELQKNIQTIYIRYLEYQQYVWDIDSNLQMSLEIYSKNDIWENQPFLKPNRLIKTK